MHSSICRRPTRTSFEILRLVFGSSSQKKESGNKLYDKLRKWKYYFLQNGKLKLPKAGWIRIKQHRSIDDRYTLKGVTVIQEADDKYYVSLLYAAEKPEHKIRPVKTAIGLDFSMNELYVDSTGAHADYPHFFRKSQEKTCKGAAQAESL